MKSHVHDFEVALQGKKFYEAIALFDSHAEAELWAPRLVRLIKENNALFFMPPRLNWQEETAPFVKWVADQLIKSGVEEAHELIDHLQQVTIFTNLFLKVTGLREKSVLSQLSTAQQLWGVLDRSYTEWISSREQLADIHPPGSDHVDMRSVGFKVGDDRVVTPDSVKHSEQSQYLRVFISHIRRKLSADGEKSFIPRVSQPFPHDRKQQMKTGLKLDLLVGSDPVGNYGKTISPKPLFHMAKKFYC